ncbi:MAG: hypothetical protein HPY71_14380 [Firmicutes bacterium]|nr:hypothetical protein [Bacillota bacterium]
MNTTSYGASKSKLDEFYKACKKFERGESKVIEFAGKVKDLKYALTTYVKPDRPGAA